MSKNELTNTNKNEVQLSGGLAIQQRLLNELDNANKEFGKDFTPYGRTCAINCIAGLVMFCKNNGIEFGDIDPTGLRLQVQNVGYTELNYASIPAEIYFDLRKSTKWIETKDENGKAKKEAKTVYNISIKPQGAGNEKLVRKYGVGLKKGSGLRNAILIREGDEFIMPQFDGLQITAPVYKPQLKNANNKVVAVMYPVEKDDGTAEYLIATREGIKPNLIAQIRQNALYGDDFKEKKTNSKGAEYETINKDLRDKFYADLDKKAEKMSVDEMLADEELLKYINPTYTSGGSKEAMIMRKMKNNALKNYPKEYDNSYVAESVRNMFEEQDKSVLEKKRDIVNDVEHSLDEDLNEDKIMDFTADEETPAEEHVEETKNDDEPF